jgi:hypothetical protein
VLGTHQERREMKKIQAYWGKRQTTPKACPLGKRACYVELDDINVAYRYCEHYQVDSRPADGKSVGPCFVNCSAPTKKAKP